MNDKIQKFIHKNNHKIILTISILFKFTVIFVGLWIILLFTISEGYIFVWLTMLIILLMSMWDTSIILRLFKMNEKILSDWERTLELTKNIVSMCNDLMEKQRRGKK